MSTPTPQPMPEQVERLARALFRRRLDLVASSAVREQRWSVDAQHWRERAARLLGAVVASSTADPVLALARALFGESYRTATGAGEAEAEAVWAIRASVREQWIPLARELIEAIG